MPGPDPPRSSQPLTLPEMLQKLVRERSTGVLRVQGAEGWKVVDIQSGAIHLVTGTEGKRLRLGDILVGRGKVSPEEIHRALDEQKRSGLPLGEVLAQRGLVSRSDILDIVRFQIEEEIYDLFTWKGAMCTFEPNATLGAQIDAYPDAAKLAIDPQRILTEAARRIPAWQRIETVVYSANVSFRLTDRGGSMLETATRGGRRLLEFIQEGYQVESIVRKSMVGRFAIWKALTDLLEAQAATAIPDDELEQLADAWEAEGKLEQALGAYLRLVEVTTDRIKNGAYRGKVRLLRGRVAALETEGAEGAVEAAREVRRDVRTPVLVALTVLIVIGAAMYVTFKVTAEPSADLAPYYEALARAIDLEKQNKLAEARRVWDEYLAGHGEGGGADMALKDRDRIDDLYEGNVQRMIDGAQKLEAEKKFAEAIELYKDTLDRYSETSMLPQIRALLAKARTDSEKYTQTLDRRQIAEALERGRELLGQKRYSESMSYLQTVKSSDEAGPELRNQARKLLEVLEAAEKKAEALIEKARSLEEEGKLDEAIKVYKECYDHWDRSRPGRKAADKLTELGQDRARAVRFHKKALRRYAEGDFTGAVGNLRKAARYKGFRVAELAQKKLDDLAAAGGRARELLKRAKRLEAEGRKEEAFGALVKLVERYPHTLAAKTVVVEVRIESVPAGAQARFNGKRIGVTPVTVRVSPKEPAIVALTKPGFAALEDRLDHVRSPVMLYHLQREVLFTKDVGRPIKASPVAAADRMAVRSDELLTLFLVTSGARMWQAKLGPPAARRAKPSIAEDTVYAAGSAVASGAAARGEPRLFALYLSSGRARAEYKLPSPAVTTPVPIRLKLLAGRLFVIVGCERGEVLSFDVMARRQQWSARVRPPIRFDMAVTEQAVIVPLPGGEIRAFHVLNGRERWRDKVPGEVACDLALSPPDYPHGSYVAAITSLGELYVFSATGGGKIARVEIEGVHRGGVALVSSGTAGGLIAYVAGDDGRVRAIDTRTGSELWNRKVGKGPVPVSIGDKPVVHAGMVYVGLETGAGTARAGAVVALDAKTGREQWRLDAGSPVTAAVLASGDRLLIGTEGGKVIGLEITGTPRRKEER